MAEGAIISGATIKWLGALAQPLNKRVIINEEMGNKLFFDFI